MKFSIVTTSFNGGPYIGEAIESAWRQRFDVTGFEHIVVDAVSTDNTLDELAKFDHLDVSVKKDRGIYDGMNSAIARATGDIVVILNADDTLPARALAAARQAFETGESDIVSGGFQLRQDRQPENPRVFAPRRAPSYEGLLFGIPAINARYFRRSVFDRIGGFDLSYRLAADRAYLLKALANGVRTSRTSEALYIYRKHSGSATLSESGQAARQYLYEHLALAEAIISNADSGLVRTVRAFEAIERIKLEALARRRNASARSLPFLMQTNSILVRALMGQTTDVGLGLALWWRYRGAHSDS